MSLQVVNLTSGNGRNNSDDRFLLSLPSHDTPLLTPVRKYHVQSLSGQLWQWTEQYVIVFF